MNKHEFVYYVPDESAQGFNSDKSNQNYIVSSSGDCASFIIDENIAFPEQPYLLEGMLYFPKEKTTIPNIQQDLDIAIIAEILKRPEKRTSQLADTIKDYKHKKHNWDGYDGVPPADQAIDDCLFFLNFIETTTYLLPTPSLSGDGEINLLWQGDAYQIDLGFIGDGSYSYYAVFEGNENFGDAIPASIFDSALESILMKITKRECATF